MQEIRDEIATFLVAGHETTAMALTWSLALLSAWDSLMPAEDRGYEALGLAFPGWTGNGRDAILQPPKPQIQPSARIVEPAMSRELDVEAAD